MSAVVPIVLVCLVFLVSWAATGLYLRWARNRLLDVPGTRSSHTHPTPTGGGMGLVCAMALVAVPGAEPAADWLLALALAAMLAVLGFLDDRHRLPVLPRLLAQCMAAATLVVTLGSGWHAAPAGLAGVALGLAAVLMLVWLVNAFNFMDGIDGLAGGQALFMGLAASWLALRSGGDGDTPRVLLAAAAACAGFLAWNWPPARVFMGDAGSLALGFLFGAAVLVTARRGELPVAVWVILWAPFLCDATLTLCARALRREALHQSHRGHAYQRLARRWGSHRRVTTAVLALDCAWLLPLAMLASVRPGHGALLAVIALAPVAGAVALILARPDATPRR